MYYSKKIKKITISHLHPSQLTVGVYPYVALFRYHLLELSITNCAKNGLRVISSSLFNLKSLAIFDSPSVLSEDLDSISKLTNLESICLGSVINLDNKAVANYSALTRMKSAIIYYDCLNFSNLGLGYLVAKKELLVKLFLSGCEGISCKGYHYLTNLTNLTDLSVYEVESSHLDDIGLNMICSSCLLIKELHFTSDIITIEGLNNIHCLKYLEKLELSIPNEDWLVKLSSNIKLTDLDLCYSTISDAGLAHLSCLTNLTNLENYEMKK
jgi:hypothetical protein